MKAFWFHSQKSWTTGQRDWSSEVNNYCHLTQMMDYYSKICLVTREFQVGQSLSPRGALTNVPLSPSHGTAQRRRSTTAEQPRLSAGGTGCSVTNGQHRTRCQWRLGLNRCWGKTHFSPQVNLRHLIQLTWPLSCRQLHIKALRL